MCFLCNKLNKGIKTHIIIYNILTMQNYSVIYFTSLYSATWYWVFLTQISKYIFFVTLICFRNLFSIYPIGLLVQFLIFYAIFFIVTVVFIYASSSVHRHGICWTVKVVKFHCCGNTTQLSLYKF